MKLTEVIFDFQTHISTDIEDLTVWIPAYAIPRINESVRLKYDDIKAGGKGYDIVSNAGGVFAVEGVTWHYLKYGVEKCRIFLEL